MHDEAGGEQADADGDFLHVDQVERMLMAIVSSMASVTNDRPPHKRPIEEFRPKSASQVRHSFGVFHTSSIMSHKCLYKGN